MPETPNQQSLDILQAYNEALAITQTKLQSLNSISGAFSNALQGNFENAGKAINETRNPIFRLNASLISSQRAFKSLGVDMESVMTRATYKANILSERMQNFKSKVTSIPAVFKNKFQQGIEVESEKINASSGIMRAGYSDSINESQKIISEVRKIVVKNSAPLPGNTFTHLTVLSNTIDDAMKMAKDAGKTIQEAQTFSADVAGKIGAIGGASGATNEQTIRFGNALMSGSLNANSQMDLVERNPAMKDAMKSVMRTYGVNDFEQISKPKRMEATKMLLDKAMPDDQLAASTQSLGGAVEGIKTAISSMTDFTRSVNAFEGYKGPDLTVFDELKPIVIGLIDPMQKLIESIINNPLTDPMTVLVRNINKVSGFMGGSSKKTDKEYKDMSFEDANKELGFLDFAKFLGSNSDGILSTFLAGEKKNTFGINTSKTPIGKDVISSSIMALTSKFKFGVDAMFAEINGFLNTSTFLNGMDLGASIGTIMAQVTNAMVYLFNNLLPVAINQTGSLFKGFKDQLDVSAVIRFTQLFGTLQSIWQTLQDKFANISEDLPKFFNGVSEQFTKAGALVGTLGTVTMLLTGVFAFAARRIAMVINDLVLFTAEKLAPTNSGFAEKVRNLFSSQKEARERVKLYDSKENSQAREILINGGYSEEDAKKDKGQTGTLGFEGFAESFKEMSSKFSILENLSPEVLLGKFLGNRSEDAQTNNIQDISGLLQRANMPLTMASGMGLIPAPLAGTISALSLGTGVIGNVANVFGKKGTDADTRKANRQYQDIHYGEMTERFKSGNIGGGLQSLDLIRTNAIGPLGKLLSFLGPLGKIVTSINPAIILAIGANIPLITGAFGMIIGAVKKMYDASPKLQAAVGRFMTGIMNIFNGIKVVMDPLYKKFILPVFKFLGDVLAFMFNRLMDFLNFFTGGAFGKEATTNEEAKKIGEVSLEDRTRADNEAIEQGNKDAKNKNNGMSPINAFKGYIPRTINAAAGFGQVNVMSVMRAAQLEQKMMPANSQLIMANTSETILNAEQMQSGRLMESSRANVTVPSVNIVINGTSNQNPNEIANEVASVLMSKLSEVSNT